MKGGSKKASTRAFGSIVIVISVWMLVLTAKLVSMLAMMCGRVCSRATRCKAGCGWGRIRGGEVVCEVRADLDWGVDVSMTSDVRVAVVSMCVRGSARG